MVFGQVVRVNPQRLRFKIDYIHDLTSAIQPGDWDMARRMPLAETPKHKAFTQRFVNKLPWEETDLFKDIYARRFAEGQTVRGCKTIEELAAQYYREVDALYLDMRDYGFRGRINGEEVELPEVFIGRDGEVILSNQGNHRVAIAKLLNLPYILARVRTRHADLPTLPDLEVYEIPPVLPACAKDIPAMTTLAERVACYELALEHGTKGEIVELGTWLGAVTANLAAGLRDAGARRRLHAYDRFEWQPIHEHKAGGPLQKENMLEQFRANLGPLMHFVAPHAGEILAHSWNNGPISLLVCDAPKRTREIAATFERWGVHLMPGAMTAWQDFYYFPAYHLPAAFDTLETIGVVKFVTSVYPGTMAIFRIQRQPKAGEITEHILSTKGWGPVRIMRSWGKWRDRLPERARDRFMVGACMFLYDVGAVDQAQKLFRSLLASNPEPIVEKFRYFSEHAPRVKKQYPGMFREVEAWTG